MWVLAAYFLIGIVACVAVASSDEKRRDELPLAMLFDPVWPLLLLWPLWLGAVLVEGSFPKEESSPVLSAPAFADPIGQIGVVVSTLRPVGRIQVGREYFDARSDGRIIPVGAVVRVLSRSLSEYVVEEEPNKAPEPTTTAGTSAAEQPLVPAAVVAHL
jgi:Membrane-bound serine protease (ClpP class)